MAFLELRDIAKSFGETVVLREVSLGVEEGETLVLLGPSGSGKTTLLRLIAGFETAEQGDVLVKGRSVGALAPAERNFGMVFQHYALFPHLSVGENVAFGLASRRLGSQAIRDRVERALEQVDLAGLADRRIDAISGGQQQRVALARALAPEPEVLLLDEPLSNLDPELRERTRQELASTLARIGITAVWVTHEQEEAFDVGTRVALLHLGGLEQVGRPEDLYRRPATPFVAAFVGRTSVLRGRRVAEERVEIEVPGRDPVALSVRSVGSAAPGPVDVYVRPELWELVEGEQTGRSFLAEALSRRFAGRENLVRLRLESGTQIEMATEADIEPGQKVAVQVRVGAARPTAFPVLRDAS